jgi:hypothetical protein
MRGRRRPGAPDATERETAATGTEPAAGGVGGAQSRAGRILRELKSIAAIAAFLVAVAVAAIASLGIDSDEPETDTAAHAEPAARGQLPEDEASARGQLAPADVVAARVEELRGLRFERRTRIELVSSDDLAAELKRIGAAEQLKVEARERAEGLAAASQVLTLSAGTIPPDAVRDQESKHEGPIGVLGLYSPSATGCSASVRWRRRICARPRRSSPTS